VCQCWYCADYEWNEGVATCHSPCDHGCAGACAYNDANPKLGNCSAIAGQGCGPVCGCRSSDCQGGPNPTSEPPPPATPPPPIPAGCPAPDETRDDERTIPPQLAGITFEPAYPVVVGQDPDRQGFRLHIQGQGGRYEHKTQRLEQWCGPASAGEAQGRYPADCPHSEWHWECPWRCAECYDDPFAAVQINMRLADSAVAWIQGELASRYTGARLKEGLPHTWQLSGVANQMAFDLWWRYAPGQPDVLSTGPVDPGSHGGRVLAWTTGTPKSAPQLVQAAFEAPVYLLDTTIDR
jgi:hypothetical protein